ncbi:hypothetical protein AX774_g8038 [Zancudomyces culisetae]|uniref:Uncharacterized protein n=1 Tax=Zancudomyces culisetae TaxID=1213189 RepID=A0A1R1PC73_ZANCU|nr:hypothetical protein AX774_g8038 [Zancudomyces culisetae]|eukprot:OMH78568.1 hypothetical protein AX774_g8038 [Zancudomyces culisetae]
MEIQQARRGTNREYGYTRHPRYTDSYEKPNDYGSRYNIPEKRQRLYDDRREYINRDGASSGSDRRGENKSVDFVAKSEKVENSVSDHADRQIKYRSMLIKDLGQYPYDVEEFFQHLSPRYANEDVSLNYKGLVNNNSIKYGYTNRKLLKPGCA